MELIKRIKEAETEAQQIIEKAKTDAAAQAEQGHKSRIQALEEAEQQRKKIIEESIAAAKTEALAEVEKLKARAEKDRHQLRDKANAKIDKAIAKVMDLLKG